MRITLTTKQFYPSLGGSIRYADLLAAEFVRQGHTVTIVTRTADTSSDNYSYAVIRRPNAASLFQIALRTDVLFQVEASWQDAWPFLLLRKPWFTSIHRGYLESKEALSDWIKLRAERFAYQWSHCISVSRYAQESWKVAATTIVNPFEAPLFYPPSELSVRDIDVIYVGRLSEDKGCLVFLAALRVLAEKKVPVRAVVVGDGPEAKRIKAEALAAGDSVSLEILGRKTPAESADLMRRSRILVYPTTTRWLDASPLSIPEALACGCRIVASDWAGIPESTGGFARLVPPGDVDTLVIALEDELRGDATYDPIELENYLSNRQIQNVAKSYLALFSSPVK